LGAEGLLTTGMACCRAGIHCSSCPEPLLIKDIKVQVRKQKLSDVCPAQMKHKSDMTRPEKS
jgi:predicted MarR family transcription regulator